MHEFSQKKKNQSRFEDYTPILGCNKPFDFVMLMRIFEQYWCHMLSFGLGTNFQPTGLCDIEVSYGGF